MATAKNLKKKQPKRKPKAKPKSIKRCSYGRENLLLAIEEVKQGETFAAVSRKFSIPESTIRARCKGKYADKSPGPNTILSKEEEESLVKWIFICANRGFPVTKQQLLQSVQLLIIDLKRQNPFKDNLPGRHWFEGFLKRHSNISARLTENVNLRRAKVTEIGIRSWFAELKAYLELKNILYIDKSRVFNTDETPVPLNLKSLRVLVKKGTKNVTNIVGDNEKENVTVLVTGNADGQLAPPLLLFAGKKLPPKVTEELPEDYSAGFSENGWMTAKNFYEYIANVFHPWLVKNSILFPVILYIDGHSSHLTLPLSEFCEKNGIILIALKANATHILQPLDVALFRTLKSAWQKTSNDFCKSNNLLGIKKYQVGNVLKNALESINLGEVLENGFQKCGLYPFDANAVDYSKVFKRITENSYEGKNICVNLTQNQLSGLSCIESMIGETKLRAFKSNLSHEWYGQKEDESLFRVWYNLSKAAQPRTEITIQETNDSNANVNIIACGSVQAGIMESLGASKDCENSIQILLDQNVDVDSCSEQKIHFDMMFDMAGNLVSENDISQTKNVFCDVLKTPVDHEQTILNRRKEASLSVDESTKSYSSIIFNSSEKDILSDEFFPHLNQNVLSSADTSLKSGLKANSSLEPRQDSALVSHVPFIEALSKEESPQISDELQAKDYFFRNDPGEDDSTKNANKENNPAQSTSTATQDIKLSEEKPKISSFSDVTNSQDKIKSEFAESFKKILFWPKEELEEKSAKRCKQKRKLPSVLTSQEWQRIKQEDEASKLKLQEDAALRKKLRLEKRSSKTLEKEQNEIKKRNEKVRKEELKLQKEAEKIKKQQERLKKMEALKNRKEEELRKKREAVQIENDLKELKNKEAVLLRLKCENEEDLLLSKKFKKEVLVDDIL